MGAMVRRGFAGETAAVSAHSTGGKTRGRPVDIQNVIGARWLFSSIVLHQSVRDA